MAQHTVYDYNYYNTKRSPSCPNGSTHSIYSYTIIISGVSIGNYLTAWVQALSKVTAQVDAYKLKLTEECTTCTYSYVTASTIILLCRKKLLYM